MAGKLVLAIGFSTRLLGCSTTWQLASHREGDPREHGGSGNVFYDSAVEVTVGHLHSVPLATQSSPDWM